MGAGLAEAGYLRSEYLLSFYVVHDEKPSAAPKLLIKSVIRTQCVQGGAGGRPGMG